MNLVKEILTFCLLVIYILVNIGCNGGKIGEKKITGNILINNRIWEYTCDFDCSSCRIYNSISGAGPNNLTVTQREVLNRQCAKDRADQMNTVVKKVCKDDCTECYGYNRFGDLIRTYTDPNDEPLKDCVRDKMNNGQGCDEDPSRELIQFVPADGSANKYGFDNWHNIECKADNADLLKGQNVSYISVKLSGETQFKVLIDIKNRQLYDRYQAKIVDGNGAASFTNCSGCKKIDLFSGENKIDIHGEKEGTAEIEVWAIADIKDDTGVIIKTTETCIAGNRENHPASDDRLKIKIYQEHVFKELNVYTVSNSNFKPTSVELQDGFNQTLKQMVSKLSSFNTNVKNDQGDWDLNENSVLDMIEDYGVNEYERFNKEFPADIPWQSEAHEMIIVNDELNKSAQNNSHAHFIVHQSIRSHWILRKNYSKTDPATNRMLYLHSTMGINVGYAFRIGKYYEPSDNDELLDVTFVGSDFIMFKKTGPGGAELGANYLTVNNITIYRDGNINGFCEYNSYPYVITNTVSASFAVDKSDYKLHTHEFLHHKLNNSFTHLIESNVIPYINNIMGPKHAGNELTYRKLTIQSGYSVDKISQWTHIGNRTYEE